MKRTERKKKNIQIKKEKRIGQKEGKKMDGEKKENGKKERKKRRKIKKDGRNFFLRKPCFIFN